MAHQRAYLSVVCIADHEITRGDGKTTPAGTKVVYNLGYPSITEAMAHIAYIARGIGRPVEIVAGSGSDLAPEWWCLPDVTVMSQGYVAWAKAFVASMRGFRTMCDQIAALHLPLLPQWPPEQRLEAKEYWRTRMDRAKRLGYVRRTGERERIMAHQRAYLSVVCIADHEITRRRVTTPKVR